MTKITGCWGIIKDDIPFVTFQNNELDGAPEFMGEDVVEITRKYTIKDLEKLHAILIFNSMVNNSETQYKFDNLLLRSFFWPFPLRLFRMLINRKYYNHALFPKWYYIIDLDSKVFTVYQRSGKYTKDNETSLDEAPIQYKNVLTFPIKNIPENWIEIIFQEK